MATSAKITRHAAVIAIALALGGCGTSSKPVAVRVGDVPITKSAVAHWMSVIQGGRTGAASASVRKQALELLISRQWLIGEAAARGVAPTGAEVRQQLERLESTEFPGGATERAEFLKASGETLADLELQARAEIASTNLHRMATDSIPTVTQAQIAAYYAAHRRSFLVLGKRRARFRNTKHLSTALQLKQEVEAGKSLTSPAQRQVGELFTGATVPPGNMWEKAIDSAPLHRVSGPYKIQDDYWLYEVVKVISAHQQALADVEGSIRSKLTTERKQKALAELVSTWKTQWTIKTNCKPGYVIQRCKQYKGPTTTEDPFTVQ